MAGSNPWPSEKMRARWSALPPDSPARVRPAVVLLCGAMSPVHRGHVAAARYALASLEARGFGALCAWLNPASDSDCVARPSATASWHLRLYLIRLAIASFEELECGLWLPSQASEAERLQPGTRVRVAGSQLSHCNGKIGAVLEFIPDKAHWRVIFEDGEENAFKGECLVVEVAAPGTTAKTGAGIANASAAQTSPSQSAASGTGSPTSPTRLRGRKPPSPILQDTSIARAAGVTPVPSPAFRMGTPAASLAVASGVFPAASPGAGMAAAVAASPATASGGLQQAPFFHCPSPAVAREAVRALQAEIHRCVPQLQGSLSIFLVCDARTAEAMRGSFLSRERHGLIVVLRPGESPPGPWEDETLIVLEPIAAPYQNFTGDIARAVLHAGDEASSRQILPEAVARVFLKPSQDEQLAFAQELAKFLPSDRARELSYFAARQQAETSKPVRERLRAWLIHAYGSAVRGLRSFDVDCSGSISAQELLRAATQAGIQAPERQILLEGLGLSHGASCSADELSARLDSTYQPPPKEFHVPAAEASMLTAVSSTGMFGTSSVQNFVQLAQEILKMQKETKARLLKLFEPAAYARRVEDRQNEALQLLAEAIWQQVYSVGDDYGCTLLLLASKDGMTRLCTRILQLDGPSFEERSSYANRANAMGWTPLTGAAQNGFHDVCEVLLQAYADPNIATSGTRLTPLMLASSNGHVETVQVLLDLRCARPFAARASAWQTASDGRTALEFVRARIRMRRRLADDVQAGKDVLDAYGVRSPHLAESVEPYSDIDRILMTLTKGNTDLGVLRQDLLLDVESENYQGGVMRGDVKIFDHNTPGIFGSMMRHARVVVATPSYIEAVGSSHPLNRPTHLR